MRGPAGRSTGSPCLGPQEAPETRAWLRVDPDLAETLEEPGRALVQTWRSLMHAHRDLADLNAWLTQEVQLEVLPMPDRAHFLARRAELHLRAGRLQRAEADAQALVDMDATWPATRSAWVTLGMVALAKQDEEAAHAAARRALDAAPDADLGRRLLRGSPLSELASRKLPPSR